MRLAKLILIWLIVTASIIASATAQRTFLDSPANVKLLRAFKIVAARIVDILFMHKINNSSPIFSENQGILTGMTLRYKLFGYPDTISQSSIMIAHHPDGVVCPFGQLEMTTDFLELLNIEYASNIRIRAHSLVMYQLAGRGEVPTSVHRLRPGDIDVIGAMGDSLTAGLGTFASSLRHMVIENRGAAASGGGQGSWREYLTLPNIIKMFNPNLIGYAPSDSFTFQRESQFNVAETGAMSKDMTFMTQELIKRIKNDSRVDIQNHWKMITILIGANDFCVDMCYLPNSSMVLPNHKKVLIKVLRLLRDELPRTFVSIMSPPNLQKLVEITGRPTSCKITNDLECPCLFGLSFRSQRRKYYEIMASWQRIEEEVTRYSEFQKDDFAVVYQPWTNELIFPTVPSGRSDLTYLAPDCFHISQKANAKAANALWNNLMEPVGKKSRDWPATFEQFNCPTKDRPYLATMKNSIMLKK